MTTPSLNEIEKFLFEEAHLLDAGQYSEWLSLFEETGYYWMPVSPKETRREAGPAIYDHDRAFLQININRLYLANAHSNVPPRRECRFVSNISIVGDEADATLVRSKIMIHEYRVREFARDDERILSGTVHHALAPTQNGFRIRWKRVDLIQSEASLTAMSTPV